MFIAQFLKLGQKFMDCQGGRFYLMFHCDFTMRYLAQNICNVDIVGMETFNMVISCIQIQNLQFDTSAAVSTQTSFYLN